MNHQSRIFQHVFTIHRFTVLVNKHMSPSPTCRFAIRDMPFRRSRCYGSLAIFSDLVPLLLRARRPKKIYCLPSAQKFPAQGTIAIINLQFTQKGKVLMFGSWIGSCPLLCTSGSSACPHDPCKCSHRTTKNNCHRKNHFLHNHCL